TNHSVDLVVCFDPTASLTKLPPDRLRRLLVPGGSAILPLRSNTALRSDEQSLPELNVEPWRLDERQLSVATTSDLPGSADWNHIYGRADNSAFAGETLDGARVAEDFDVQWLGRPGPRYQADRNGRKVPPLASNGSLYLQGLDRVVAVAAHNGVVRWSLEIPGFRRCNMPRDCGNWCVDDDWLYAAVDDACWRINASNGNVERRLELPPGKPSDSGDAEALENSPRQWGYIAQTERFVLGTSTAAGASWTDFWGGPGWYDAEEGAAAAKVLGRQLFALNKQSFQPAWTYQRGAILHSTITVANSRVFFVECRHPEVVANETGRFGGPKLWQKQFLTALDLDSGEVVWEAPLDTVDGVVVFSMAHGSDKLVIVSSNSGRYHVYGMSDEDGRQVWKAEFAWGKGKADHGTHLARPAIVGSQVFVRPVVIDLESGAITNDRMPVGGCGTYACTTEALFFRSWSGGDFAMWTPESEEYTMWSRLRPDCWLSTIPAGGMLLSPEGGGGCSCGKWLETSLGFIPKTRLTSP
ncbi:MAG: PQQ-binding-like beta-propeller repeat protein, partial [Planctomycetota bacterium]